MSQRKGDTLPRDAKREPTMFEAFYIRRYGGPQVLESIGRTARVSRAAR